jgi:hypothetical protein
MISPTAVDFKTGELSLKVNPALAKILTHKSNSSFEITDTECRLTNHCDRKISIKQAIALLARNSIFTSETEVVIILEFLYAVAKTYSFHYSKSDITLSGNRTDKKHQKSLQKIAF